MIMFGFKSEKLTENLRKSHNEGLNSMYLVMFRVTKSRSMRLRGAE
jgi:hypothetical protein